VLSANWRETVGRLSGPDRRTEGAGVRASAGGVCSRESNKHACPTHAFYKSFKTYKDGPRIKRHGCHVSPTWVSGVLFLFPPILRGVVARIENSEYSKLRAQTSR
jgi:hypothetical protein